LAVPGDKSISHRALILGALAPGSSTVAGLNVGDDVLSTARCLASLGASIELDKGRRTAAIAEGTLREPAGVLDAGNSGTTMRLLAGVAARLPGLTVLTGDETLLVRPMLRVVAPLRQMGATVDGRRNGELPPLAVRGGELKGLDFHSRVASAQVKSAILLAGLGAEGETSVTEPAPSRDHTERMLHEAGVELERDELRVGLTGPQEVATRDWHVPGDVSSALFLVVAALLRFGSDLTITDVGLNPTRTAALDVLRQMGAEIETDHDEDADGRGEPVGRIRARHSALRGVRVAGSVVPALIDEIPILAIAATQAEGETVFADAEELRHKESDRVEAMVEGIRVVGGNAEATEDGFVVTGPTPLTGGTVESRGDHRIALAFAVAGLIASDVVRVMGWTATSTSFPEFLDLLDSATRAR
jgi:3-phosphoshikimate 1-carboxyvinyltransferase